MNNPIKIYEEIREAYLKYINSGLPFSRDEYNEERNELLRTPGTISQPPIIELVPKYHERASLREFCENEGISTEINDFINAGLFANNTSVERKLYGHQYEALKEAFINRKNTVVTTGTGSGKTECFLLPVISDLVAESSSWDDDRPRAIRTLILYPLNALAEDQMIRLRKALNSRKSDGTGARDWLDAYRNGNRFYFGRYTGRTPVSGVKKVKGEFDKEKESLEKGWRAAIEAAARTNNSDLLYHVPCMDTDSAEMWDRFSMQEKAPDILITNFSMLNVMLMREDEAGMFEATKQWLAEDSSHVFHLVIDELHTYRGTAGTEVAYLLRVLLDRLGLTPESSQVQFLASSASLKENEQSKEYLREFFGYSESEFSSRFKVISNPKTPHPEKPEKQLPLAFLKDYINTGDDKALFKNTSCSSYCEICKKYKLLDWLKYGLDSDKGIIAKDVENIAKALDLPEEIGPSVIGAIVKIICQSKDGSNFIAPIRAHFFFRNVSGLWGCTDPNCTEKRQGSHFDGRIAGRFFKRPRTMCTCGNNVLEVLLCENCGELFFGGYKVRRGSSTFLTAERPMTDSFVSYCVLWRGHADEKNGWKQVWYNPATGEYTAKIGGDYSLYEQQSDDETCFPHKCPQCEIKYRVEDKDSLTPIRRHGAGLQKVNQILADALIRSMKNEQEDNTKVVLFSDSRQSAAKLSAGIELDHYRDVLRWAILKSLKENESTSAFLKSIYAKDQSAVTEQEKIKLGELRDDDMYKGIATSIFCKWLGIPLTEEANIELKQFLASTDAQKLDSIEDKVRASLLKFGINPAGPKPSYSKIGGDIYWYDLFSFKTLQSKKDLQGNELVFCRNIIGQCRIEQLVSIFSNSKRSFEELRLGYLAPTVSIPDKMWYEYVCSAIRIMGETKRIKDIPKGHDYEDSFPNQVRELTKKVFGISSNPDVNDKLDELRSFLRNNKIIDENKALLTGKELSFVPAEAGSQYWVCPKCKTVHMQHSNGYCSTCFAKLGEPLTLSQNEVDNPEDYYLSVLNSTDKIYRLHCEEMSGQTTKEDSLNRQRYFQDIFLDNELPLVSGIDLLSVTTTMEAGVDIGSLSAVMMGNVPPQRFNYQQRVGRAGRRGKPLSIALTVAKGSSHDQTHFFEYERMVSDTPKDPYLEVRTPEIAERIIFKEVLYFALKSINDKGSRDSVHGNFGKSSDWENKKGKVQNWIDKNDEIISHIIDTVTTATSINNKTKQDIKKYVQSGLLDRISVIAKSDDYTQEYLSERLANAGLLPMYGFPTLTRNLYLDVPKKLPAEKVVSRDAEMALSSFTPGHEIVLDKKVYRAVGIVDYTYPKGSIKPETKDNSHNPYKKPLHRCASCGYSTVNSCADESICPVCGEPMEEISICSPLGYCVDYYVTPVDFNGSYDWYSPNSDIKLDCEDSLTLCTPVRNLRIRNNVIPSQGLVHLVNDNNGCYYTLGKRKGRMYNGILFSKEACPEHQLYDENKFAFVASKSTGVLTISVEKASDKLNLSPLRSENRYSNSIRAAYLSWGYLVRKAIASYLDIDSSELSVGFYITPQTKQAEVFFVEKLENGAGYCNYLSGRKYPDVPFKAIIDPLLPNGDIYKHLVSEEHSRECTSSCYDCIRDYSNQFVHGLLNWRLGLDLAKLAADETAEIDFSASYWREYLDTTIRAMLSKRGFAVYDVEGTLRAINPEGYDILLVHPFWSEAYIDEIVEKVDGSPTLCDISTLASMVEM